MLDHYLNHNPQAVLHSLQEIRTFVIQEGEQLFNRWRSQIEREAFSPGALNLAHYLALRRQDLRELQLALVPWGLSSLGRIESRVLSNLDAVIVTLGAVCQADPQILPPRPPLDTFFEGDRLLTLNTDEVFGASPRDRQVRIMVTMPTEAADNYHFVRKLLKRGMNCIRINCAHDQPEAWKKMISHLQKAEQELNRSCKVFMDLSGPKVRLKTVILPRHKRRLNKGDLLHLSLEDPKQSDDKIFQASCQVPEIFTQVKAGEKVWIDDGHIGFVVETVNPEKLELRVTNARPKGEKLRPDKGINFPDSVLNLNSLSEKDQEDLDFVANHADIIGYSFVQSAQDILVLQQELQKRLGDHWQQKAIIAKIETLEAIRNLPEIIVQAAGQQPFGVMIARGDLAVEIGYQRLAEMQEEILWICQAAQVPVIWATQVLENLVKRSVPSRAEMTDAAMSERAECVMLNKGEFIGEAVTILDDVLIRMESHQSKKSPQLRALHSW
ncbi:MAG: pyruvate kinase [Merismopediaceae bacterium]|nr:pyruvate kinase [Merismopediaceae bacterium]